MDKAGVLVSVQVEAERLRRQAPLLPQQRPARLDGPFSESKELIGGFCVLELRSIDEAVALCRCYAVILGGTLEIDIREAETSRE